VPLLLRRNAALGDTYEDSTSDSKKAAVRVGGGWEGLSRSGLSRRGGETLNDEDTSEDLRFCARVVIVGAEARVNSVGGGVNARRGEMMERRVTSCGACAA